MVVVVGFLTEASGSVTSGFFISNFLEVGALSLAGVDAAGAGDDFLSYCPRITLSGVPIYLIVMVTGMLISVVLPLMLAT